MKKVILSIAIIIGISAAANAQISSKKETKEKPNMEIKDHTCTDACKNGTHVYAHGEKGHICTEECEKMNTSSTPMEMKDHVCTDACKNGTHVYAHGEKGHTCTEACKKKM